MSTRVSPTNPMPFAERVMLIEDRRQGFAERKDQLREQKQKVATADDYGNEVDQNIELREYVSDLEFALAEATKLLADTETRLSGHGFETRIVPAETSGLHPFAAIYDWNTAADAVFVRSEQDGKLILIVEDPATTGESGIARIYLNDELIHGVEA